MAGTGPGADAPVVGVRVRVPATSANLGPGFDAFGLALGFYDDVEVTLRPEGLAVTVEGAENVSKGEDNLVVRAIRATFDELGRPQPGLVVRCVNRVPHGRGLGSSAAAIVAGVAAAWVLDTAAYLDGAAAGRTDGSHRAGPARPGAPGGRTADAVGFDRAAALRVATAIEGHPDNVAAALFGGFTVAWTGPAGPVAHRAEPVADLRPVAFVPSARTSTADSRGRLPDRLAHGDAAFSAGRAGLLALALTQTDLAAAVAAGGTPGGVDAAAGARSARAARARLLLAATEDRLHQPYRLPVVPESAALVDRLRAAGVAAVLSGSGPTVLALAVGGEQAAGAVGVAAPGFAVLPLAVDRDGVRVANL
ncbi:homoserine kinase [Pseudofrankia sp. EUN1h]|nr:homoserine kinase [Pseudofrankia sp. EUN1h]